MPLGRSEELRRGPSGAGNRTAILVTAWPGQPHCAELERMAAAGERPRTDYVEVARRLDAEVMDGPYMHERALPLARLVASRVGMDAGQVLETFLRRGQYRHVLVWGERRGLPLASLFKLFRCRNDLVLVSPRLTRPVRIALLRLFKVHTHLRAMSFPSSVQMMAAERLGVPRDKLRLALPGVDERFWRPEDGPVENRLLSVGREARDYPTFFNAVRDLDVGVDLVAGGVAATAVSGLKSAGLERPSNVRLHGRLSWLELRQCYAQSRFVVVPTLDVDFNAGITTVKEAMAMGKAVIVTRSRGQVDYVRDGEHGIHVPPCDATALRAAMEFLLGHPEEAERMGRAGRALVAERHPFDGFVTRLVATVREADGRPAEPKAPGRRAVAAGPIAEK